MNKLILLVIFVCCLSCDDGDLQIETLDFDSVNIQFCSAAEADLANVFFKLNSTEALILELPAGTLKNAPTTDLIVSSVGVAGPSKISYRTFSDNVTASYFCDEIPVVEPNVVDEIIATGGEVFITSIISADSTNYEHTIELSGISLLTSNDTRITNLSIDNFGTVTTVISSE